MSAPKLTVREVVAALRDVATAIEASGYEVGDRMASVLARWDAEVEAEEREEHRRALEAAESEAREPW